MDELRCLLHPTLSPYFVDEDIGVAFYIGDSLDLLSRVPIQSFDMIFADPPYFLSNDGMTCHSGQMVSVNKGRWDQGKAFDEVHAFNLNWLNGCRRVLNPDGTVWVSGTHHNIFSVGYAMQVLGFKILNDIAWYKVTPPPNLSCRYFTHATETILWAKRSLGGRHTFHYEAMKEEGDPRPGRQMQSLWRIRPPGRLEKRHGRHPTQKPEALLNRILRASTNPGDLVLDPFCGSGTSAVACVRLGRRFVGIDLVSEYLDLAVKRVLDEIRIPRFAFHLSVQVSARISSGGTTSTWAEIVCSALRTLGGEGTVSEINAVVLQNPRTRSNSTWPCTVRRVLRETSRIRPLCRGQYRLMESESSREEFAIP